MKATDVQEAFTNFIVSNDVCDSLVRHFVRPLQACVGCHILNIDIGPIDQDSPLAPKIGPIIEVRPGVYKMVVTAEVIITTKIDDR